MSEYSDKIQDLMDEVYDKWQKRDNKSKWEVLEGFSDAHKIAVTFGNFNYQVENGGIEQWIFNGYFHDDSEKFIEYLETGAETDSRCRNILDRIYRLDQYAQETGSDRDGYFHDPDDGGEGGFIGDIINCNQFDTWYYENCGGDDWWELVSGIIDKTEPQLALTDRHEHIEEDIQTKPPIQVYIENVGNPHIGSITMPLPTTREELLPFLDGVEISGWQDMKIGGISSDIDWLGYKLYGIVSENMTPHTLNELNYLAARIESFGEAERGIFSAVIESGKLGGNLADIINLTFDENLGRFDLQPAFSEERYGDFLLDTQKDETAGIFRRFESSADPDEKAFAAYILRLEANIKP